jgi:hypothetical protein
MLRRAARCGPSGIKGNMDDVDESRKLNQDDRGRGTGDIGSSRTGHPRCHDGLRCGFSKAVHACALRDPGPSAGDSAPATRRLAVVVPGERFVAMTRGLYPGCLVQVAVGGPWTSACEQRGLWPGQ